MGRRIVKKKLNFNVGTIGHINHGKTTLTAAITTVLAASGRAEATNYPSIASGREARKDQVTMKISHVEYESDDRRYYHIDCPTHADYVKSLMTGEAALNAAILVVSATEGPMSQTHDHIILSRQVGIPFILVYLNRCDLVDDIETLNNVEQEIRNLLTRCGYPGNATKIIRGSALKALNGESGGNGYGTESIQALLTALDQDLPNPVNPEDSPFLMPIEDIQYIAGTGFKITGRIESGTIKMGAEVEILGLDKRLNSTVRGIELFGKQAEAVFAGDNATILLPGVEKSDYQRGMVLTKPGSVKAYTKVKAVIYILKKEEGGRAISLTTNDRLDFYLRKADTACVILELFESDNVSTREMAVPGDTIGATIELTAPVALSTHLRFAIRKGAGVQGIGVVTQIIE